MRRKRNSKTVEQVNPHGDVHSSALKISTTCRSGRARKMTASSTSELASLGSQEPPGSLKEPRKDSLVQPTKRRRISVPGSPPFVATFGEDAHEPQPKRTRNMLRNEPRHIYVCAYYDDLLTPEDDEERKRRGHLAFNWDLFVKRESIDASGTHFHLTTQHVRPRYSAIGGAEPMWRPRSQVRLTDRKRCTDSEQDSIGSTRQPNGLTRIPACSCACVWVLHAIGMLAGN